MNEPAYATLWRNFFRKPKRQENRLEVLLSEVPIFSQLTDRELQSVAAITHYREYSRGEVIFSQGDPGLGMYVIENGEVEIIHYNGEMETTLAILKTGDFFGELSLLDESPRSASAVAVTQSKIVGFFKPDLMNLLNRLPKAGIKVLFKLGEIIGARLRVTNEQLAKISVELSRAEEKQRS
jgi:CRP/FNR family cyclic AMP-dependent transcriptional regulator